MPDASAPLPNSLGPLPDFTRWPSFPFEGTLRVKPLQDPVAAEPPRQGENGDDCVACAAPDEAYIWVGERWRVRTMDRPSGLPAVLILETRSHLDLGDLPNLLAAELGVMTVRLERAIRSLDGVARVHVNRWGDGSAHLHLWFLARPYGQLQLRGTFLSLWDDILPPISESQWRENLALVAAWLAEFGGTPLAQPPHFAWQTPANLADQATAGAAATAAASAADVAGAATDRGGPVVPRPRIGDLPPADRAPAAPHRSGRDTADPGAAASGPGRPDPAVRHDGAAASDDDGWDDDGWEDPEPEEGPGLHGPDGPEGVAHGSAQSMLSGSRPVRSTSGSAADGGAESEQTAPNPQPGHRQLPGRG